MAVGVGSTRLDGEAFEELGQNGGVARVVFFIKLNESVLCYGCLKLKGIIFSGVAVCYGFWVTF